LVHVETERASEKLVNQRLAYVAVPGTHRLANGGMCCSTWNHTGPH
jgi:hypothetical protein